MNTNPGRYWFKRRRFGWGWTPVTREGWLVIVAFMIALVGGAVLVGDRMEESGWWMAAWLTWAAAWVIALLILTARHAPPGKWRWGRKPTDNPTEDI